MLSREVGKLAAGFSKLVSMLGALDSKQTCVELRNHSDKVDLKDLLPHLLKFIKVIGYAYTALTRNAMSSLFKASESISQAKGKGKGKGTNIVEGASDKAKSKPRKDKVLLLCSRGVTQRHRHLMRDLEVLLPHTKKGQPFLTGYYHSPCSCSSDSKLDTKSSLHLINELSDLHSCNNTLYFEARRHEDLYLWLSRSPNGPSVKCHVQNIHTMDELKMTGNCLRGSRGICLFDGGWEEGEEWMLLKELFTHVS
jgi:ribosome biogenesis protein BRX1